MAAKSATAAATAPDVGDDIAMEPTRWKFGGDVPGKFVAHAQRSIPYYDDCHELIARISDHFVSERSTCYDLGASTGRLVHRLALRKRLAHDKPYHTV